MNNLVEMRFDSPRPINMNPLQRSVYLTVGLGIIISSLVAEPVSTMWFAAIHVAGIALVTSAIIGRGVRLSRLKIKGRKIGSVFQPLSSTLIAIGISVAAITTALPPAWFAIAHTVATVLMLSAILNMEFAMTAKRHAHIETLTSSTEDDYSLPKAA